LLGAWIPLFLLGPAAFALVLPLRRAISTPPPPVVIVHALIRHGGTPEDSVEQPELMSIAS
jgi:hypothetical protein